jgi:hypothetical protein
MSNDPDRSRSLTTAGPAIAGTSVRLHVEAALVRIARAERALRGFREALLEDLQEATDAERRGCLTVLGGLETSFAEAAQDGPKCGRPLRLRPPHRESAPHVGP